MQKEIQLVRQKVSPKDLFRRRLQSVFIGISFLAEDLLGECIFVRSIDILPYRYILEAPDTQATNESQAFKIHVLNWLYIFYLCSYWLSCRTGSSGRYQPSSLYKVVSNGPLDSPPPNSQHV